MTMKITIKLVLRISVQTTTCHYKSQAFSALPKTEDSLGLIVPVRLYVGSRELETNIAE